VADPAAGAEPADHGQDHVFGAGPGGQLAVDVDRHRLGPRLGQGLSGQHVFDFAGADTEGQGPEGAMGGGVGVAADHGHPRLGQTLLGTDHVHDALARLAHLVEGDTELGGVGPHDLDLTGADGIGDRLVDVLGGDVVILGGHCQLGPSNLTARQSEPVEGLGRGDLVDQVEVDIEQVGFTTLALMDEVALPDVVCQGVGFVGHDGGPP
jgi:hypothetical protein